MNDNKKSIEMENIMENMNEGKTVKGYKGFSQNLKCRGYQYVVGQTYEHKGQVACCESGFHFCENPIDVLRYYGPASSRYCVVEGSGDMEEDVEDSIIAAERIRICKEIGLKELVDEGMKYIMEKGENIINKVGTYSISEIEIECSLSKNKGYNGVAVNTGHRSISECTGIFSLSGNTGNCSVAKNRGDFSVAVNTGDDAVAVSGSEFSIAASVCSGSASVNCGRCSAAVSLGEDSLADSKGNNCVAVNMGDYGEAIAEGKESIALVTGISGKAKGALGCWLVLAEQGQWNGEAYPILDVKAVKVDGVKILPDVYYMLKGGEVVEVNEEQIK